MCLSTVTQSQIYKGMLDATPVKDRHFTDFMIKCVKDHIEEWAQHRPRDEHIWISIHKKEIRRNIRTFLWRSLHDSHKIGRWWYNIPNYEGCTECPMCKETETLEHILTECPSNGQETLWELTGKIWGRTGRPIPSFNLGMILGCGLTKMRRL